MILFLSHCKGPLLAWHLILKKKKKHVSPPKFEGWIREVLKINMGKLDRNSGLSKNP